MTALIITESCFGNTTALAGAIAEALSGAGGMSVESLPVADAPQSVPDGTDLLILAAPTHDYSLPRPRTRARAAARGGQAAEPGLREWIAGLDGREDVKVVTVDTAFKTGFTPSTAAKTAARLMARAGFSHVRRGATFCVSDYAGPLDDGELIRARAWAVTLAAGLRSLPRSRARTA
ncbi:MAG: hypothetical protein LBC97_16230 [Bifidobacteriaceae bacterium]|jgi:hypothetical protein|nr:hypothetical protein [Bifidobacteriaceae bacterium]